MHILESVKRWYLTRLYSRLLEKSRKLIDLDLFWIVVDEANEGNFVAANKAMYAAVNVRMDFNNRLLAEHLNIERLTQGPLGFNSLYRADMHEVKLLVQANATLVEFIQKWNETTRSLGGEDEVRTLFKELKPLIRMRTHVGS